MVTAVAEARASPLDRLGGRIRPSKLVSILLLAAAVRTWWTLVAAPAPESDFLTFLQTARLIAQGVWWPDAYGWAWQGPGYPLVIAPLTLLGAAALPAIHALNIGCGVATVWVISRVAASLFSDRAGVIAAFIAAAFPGLWLWAPIVSAENLSVLVFAAIAALLVQRTSPARILALGLLAGALVFVRPSALFFTPVVLVSVLMLAPGSSRLRDTGIFLAGAIAAIAAVTAINLQGGGPGLPVGASGWQPWLVHNERATGSWFPARDRDDYPFHGIEENPALGPIVRSAQVKMALQFALLNPDRLLPGIIDRHINNWKRDDAGLDWTVRRPGAAPGTAALGSALEGWIGRAYVAMVALSLLAVWTLADRLRLVIVLLLPIAYLTAPALFAEGNSRYHVNALPFLIALAAAGLSDRSTLPRLIPPVGVLAVALAVPAEVPVVPIMIAVIFIVAVLKLALEAGRSARRMWARESDRRKLKLLAVGSLIGAQIVAAAGFSTARQAVLDWAVAQPSHWRAYAVAPSRLTSEPSIVPSDLPGGTRKVSFPDSVILPAPADVTSEQRLGIIRHFPDIEPGTRYVLYLQISARPTPGDAIIVLANGQVVWEFPHVPGDDAGWRDVVIPWTADTPFLALQVERIETTPVDDSEVLVRSAHLYPKY